MSLIISKSGAVNVLENLLLWSAISQVQFERYFRRTATVKATELKGELLMQKKEKSQYGLGRQVKAMIRDCTVQLTIFSHGEPCIKPLWIFKAQDKELQTEKRGSMIQESWSNSKRTRGGTRKSSSSGSEIC